MKLKVGDYIRTKNHNGFPGGIGIILKTEDDEIHKTKWITLDVPLDRISFLIQQSEIIKSSNNIIDLIEVGDYVNGYKIKNITMKCDKTIKTLQSDYIYDICECNIESIVTKEQFESMEYRLGE
jgi:hypothetical protein